MAKKAEGQRKRKASKMAKKKGLTIGKTRSVLYGIASALGDVNAVKRGTVAKRVERKLLGRLLGRLFNF